MRQRLWIIFALLGTVAAVYAQAARFDYVTYDDIDYVLTNRMIHAGPTPPAVRQMFTTAHASNWHPITWLSHAVDMRLFGFHPAGHHLHNVLLHAVAAVLLLVIVEELTGRPWSAAVVAGLYALHPMHVESVAWISQRKDVLSIALGLTAVWWYVRYVKTAEVRRLVMCTLFAALAMMAKPTLVTLPLMLLLLDDWPLNRLSRRAVIEKLPLFALAAAVSAMTYHAQGQGGAMNAGADLSLWQRLAAGVVAYGQYLGKTVWPTNLSVHYVHPYLPGGAGLAAWRIAASAALLAAITAAVIALRRHRCLRVGWLWFVIALLPVIGIVQVGDRLMADRYTTWAHIGLFLAVVEMARRINLPRRVVVAATACLIAACGWATFHQASYWRDSRSLYAHGLASQPNSPLLHNNYGIVLKGAGRIDEAQWHYRRAIELDPADPLAHHNLANVLAGRGDLPAARDHYRAAVEAQPRMDAALFALARISLELNDLPTALDACRRVIALQPDLPAPHALMNNILLAAGDPDGAAIHRQRAIELDMSYADMAAVATP
jgi:hypothetical protein